MARTHKVLAIGKKDSTLLRISYTVQPVTLCDGLLRVVKTEAM